MEIRFYDTIQPACREIRTRVFIEEQGFSSEFDATDAVSEHALVWENGEALATARMFERAGELVIGRFAVLQRARGRGIGSFLMAAVLDRARAQGYGAARVDAQCRARAFYEACGFVAIGGETHEEDGVPHLAMRKAL